SEVLEEWLAEKRVLFVLDNFEQVLEAGPIVADLLRQAPGLKVLATSRAPLQVSGEQEYPVPGLPTPPDPSQMTALERARLPERQQTLRGAITWSYDILDEACRLLLDRLSVFAGDIELDAAEAVCGPAAELGQEVVDGLLSLANQSLIRAIEDPSETRFEML